MHSPAQAWECPPSAAASGTSGGSCWAGQVSWAGKKAFSPACQELAPRERGPHGTWPSQQDRAPIPALLAGPCSVCAAREGHPSACEEFCDRASQGCQLPHGKCAGCHGGSVLRVSLSCRARHSCVPGEQRAKSSTVRWHYPKTSSLKDA